MLQKIKGVLKNVWNKNKKMCVGVVSFGVGTLVGAGAFYYFVPNK